MPSQLISADEIYSRIPHSGLMRLLDAEVAWDDRSIHCTATSHGARSNPLRENGALANVHALEYAAQAIAVHGSLRKGGGAEEAALKLVYVATFRNVELAPTTLDQLRDALLDIHAEQHASVAGGWSYSFSVLLGGLAVASGSATVVAPGVPS